MVVYIDSIVDSISPSRWYNTYIGDVFIVFKCVKFCFKKCKFFYQFPWGVTICHIVSCFMEHTFLNTVLIYLQENVYFVGSIFYVTLQKSYFKYGSPILTFFLIKCFTQGCFIYIKKKV